MKTVTLNPLRVVLSRNRQQTSYSRHVVVECRIEAGDLRQIGESSMKGVSQQNLLGQMFGIERAELPQRLDHFRCDMLRFPILRSAVNHSMPHRRQRAAFDPFLNPVHQYVHRGCVVRRSHRSGKIVGIVLTLHRESGLGETDAFDPAYQILRSIPLAPNSANLMLDEPPLTVRMRAVAVS
jgi:hypothetical protein